MNFELILGRRFTTNKAWVIIDDHLNPNNSSSECRKVPGLPWSLTQIIKELYIYYLFIVYLLFHLLRDIFKVMNEEIFFN